MIKNVKEIPLNYFGGGLNEFDDPDKIDNDQCNSSINIIETIGKFGNTAGDTLHGSQISATKPIKGLDKWDTYLVSANDTKLYIKTTDWFEMVTGLTTGLDTDFIEYYDDLYYTNGTDAYGRLVKTVLTSAITAGDGTVDVSDTGKYGASGNIVIDGDIIDYTGKTATAFTGCSGALAHNNGCVVIQSSTPANCPLASFLAEYGNKMWAGGIDSTTSLPTAPWRLYYTITALATTPENIYAYTGAGSGQEFIAHGGKLTALLKFRDTLIISKTDEIEYINGFDDSSPPAPVRKRFYKQDGAINNKCLVALENDIAYFTGKRTKRLMTQENSSAFTLDTEFDDKIIKTLESLDDDQSDACMGYNPSTHLLSVSCKLKGSTFNDIRLVYDTKRKNWSVREGQYASSYVVLNGVTYYGHSIIGEVRKVDDSLTLNEGGYRTERESKHWDFGDNTNMKEFILFSIGGNISVNTILTVEIYVDGKLKKSKDITGSQINDVVGQQAFGNHQFGDQMFGGNDITSALYSFVDSFELGYMGRKINYLVKTSGIGQQYEVNHIATKVRPLGLNAKEPTI